jgi:hypothetical protein
MRRFVLCPLLLTSTVVAAACGDVNTALQHQSEARHVVADLHVQFAKATDASNRAVMATSDQGAQAAAQESEHAKAAVRTEALALKALLAELNYSDEARDLKAFEVKFAEYEALDRQILDLVAEQSNLKAQRLAFGPASEAADATRLALDALKPSNLSNQWQVKALAAEAVASVREMQAIQSPHIADTEEAAMDVKEQRMAGAERRARQSLDGLSALVADRLQLESARSSFAQFMAVNEDLVTLSRRNTNVRSLMLSLNEKRALVVECEASLQKLRQALSERGYPAGRVPAVQSP